MNEMCTATADHTEFSPVAVKSFVDYGEFLNVAATLGMDAEWVRGIRTRIHAGRSIIRPKRITNGCFGGS
ncbi:hypothetical protein BS297_24130 [Rhodococcus erythropolis]|uniref:Uncharacterized protein n=1 Tax=Rhodococcus erythropolis TaxID=1833 RepID=A0A5N5E3L0_RHOER|nr:hypothetical protein BS297_24130 [Rhodococcus erythropolis]